MPLSACADSSKPGFVLKVETHRCRIKIQFVPTRRDLAFACEVHANLHALRMKTLRPIQIRFRDEVVPLDAVTEGAEISVKLTPAVTREFPSRSFGERVRFVQFGNASHEAVNSAKETGNRNREEAAEKLGLLPS